MLMTFPPVQEKVQIKDYQIHLPPLGEGAFGTVYRATYRGISERAVKIFKPENLDLSGMARELEKLSTVAEHHGIVTLHDFDLLSQPPYYSMGLHADQNSKGEWEARTLERLCGKVDPREGWRLLREIADALSYLHRHQIIHCDVKPSNVLLTDEAPHGVKMCDFGQSRGNMLDSNEPAGTPLYASPEQLRNPRDSSEGKGLKWDVYSFGVLAYKLLTGKLPRLQTLAEAERNSFDLEATLVEGSLDATLRDTGGMNGEKLAGLTELETEVYWPPNLRLKSERKAIIERCLSLDPRERFADMREVWVEMQRVDQLYAVRRVRRLNIIFAVLLVVAIWATGFAFFQARRAREATTEAITAKEQSEQLVFFIMNDLNRELSRIGRQELLAHIAQNAETYISNLPKDQRTAYTLRLSANAVYQKGAAALARGDADEALEALKTAYEIRSKLFESNPKDLSLHYRTAENLVLIGEAQQMKGNYTDALAAFDEALTIRLERRGGAISEEQRIEGISACYSAIAQTLLLSGKPAEAAKTYQKAIDLHNEAIASQEEGQKDSQMLARLGSLQLARGHCLLAAEDPEHAETAFQLSLANSQDILSWAPQLRPQAMAQMANSLQGMGLVRKAYGDLEGAQDVFNEELKMRQRAAQRNPMNPEVQIALAESYANVGSCFDLNDPRTRSLALVSYENALKALDELPTENRDTEEVQTMTLDYQDQVSQILELDE